MMNPETKFYLIIGVIIVSSSLTTAMFAYVAFKMALRRVVHGIARAAKDFEAFDVSVRCHSDEER